MSSQPTTTWIYPAIALSAVIFAVFFVFIEERVDRPAAHPPTWRRAWTPSQMCAALLGILAAAVVVALCGGALWTIVHAFGSWTLPLRPVFYTMSLVSIGAAFIQFRFGRSAPGYSALAIAFLTALAPSVFDIVTSATSAIVDVAGASPATPASPSPTPPAPQSRVDGVQPLEPALAAATDIDVPAAQPHPDEQERCASQAAGSSQSAFSHDDSHFGVGNALMLYGAYKLLSSDDHGDAHTTFAPTAGSTPAARPAVRSVSPALTAPMMRSPAASSTPAARPIYTPAPARISAIRTVGGAARAARFAPSRLGR